MSVNYDTTLKNTRMTAVRDAVNGGTIEICSAAYAAVLAVLTLAATSGTVADGVLTFNAITQDSSADAAGTAAVARVKDSGGNVKINGLTVGTSGADVNLNKTNIEAGDIVSLSSAAITHA